MKFYLILLSLTFFIIPSSFIASDKRFNVDGIVAEFFYDEEFLKKIGQPIDFSHQTHAGKNNISCEYCHSSARKSINSGVPPVRTCMGCHVIIQGKTEEQKREIAKIKEYWDAKESIPWQKIHDLPDHVKFSHEAHLNRGFDCTTCHGEVSKMKQPWPQRIQGEIPLSMGWCVTCHRTDWGVTEEGKISLPIRQTRGGKIVSTEAPEIVEHVNGPLDCLVCHK